MAAKTRMGVGTGVTITLLALAALGFFISTVVFWSKHQAAAQILGGADERYAEVMDNATETSAAGRVLMENARNDRESASLTQYLINRHEELMAKVAGDRSMSLADFTSAVSALASREQSEAGLRPNESVANSTLLGALRDRAQTIARLKREVADAVAAREEADRVRDEQVNRMAQIQSQFEQTTTGLESTVDDYASQVEGYQQEVVRSRDNATAELARTTSEHRAERARLDEQNRELQEQVAIKDETIASLQAELRGKKFTGANEATVVDGRVLSVDPNGNTVYISRGLRDKVVVGLTFEVFADASGVRPNDAGEFAPGKATIEVISVEPSSATCRVLRSRRGNPISKDDVIVNAVYDPSKVYRFVVFGVFDANRDGVADVLETEEITALLESWGGKVEDQFSGDIDFLVLGRRPAIPPQPSPGASPDAVQFYLDRQSLARRYDELFTQAVATGIPVLNENRLYTLIGKPRGI